MKNDSTPNSDPDSLQPLDQRLCFALYASSQAIIKKYKVSLLALNMTYPQYIVYLALDPVDKMTVSELGKKLFLDSGTLTPLLKRMEGNGLVTRQRDPLDERKVIINLTKQARSMRGEIGQIQKEVSCSTNLNQENFSALLAQLHLLHNNLRDE